MRTRSFPFVLAVGATLVGVGALVPTAASAGGSWVSPERPAYAHAELAVLRGSFGTGSYEGQIDDGPFIAYLLPAARWIRSGNVPETAIPLGELVITGTGGFFRARVEFQVPDVPTGLYHVQYCNDPCTVDGIGDLIGSESFAIGATRTEARLLILVQRLRWKVDEAAFDARREASAEIRELKRELSAAQDRLTTYDVRVRGLTDALGEMRQAHRSQRSTAGAATIVAGGLLVAVVGLLLALVVITRRLRYARLDAELLDITHGRVPVER